MKYLAMCAAGVCLLAMSANAGAAPGSNAGFSRIEGNAPIIQVQAQAEPKKKETIKQKVKRAWRNLTGYKFSVACPAFPIVLNRYSCTETGKSREDARAKCQAAHPLCGVSDTN